MSYAFLVCIYIYFVGNKSHINCAFQHINGSIQTASSIHLNTSRKKLQFMHTANFPRCCVPYSHSFSLALRVIFAHKPFVVSPQFSRLRKTSSALLLNRAYIASHPRWLFWGHSRYTVYACTQTCSTLRLCQSVSVCIYALCWAAE